GAGDGNMRGPRVARGGGGCRARGRGVRRPRILLKERAMTKPRRPDPFALYEVAVQGVDWDLDFLERVWRYRNPGREPRTFREDFCSTAALATAWARRGPERRAWGVDLDPAPLAWARRHRLPFMRDAGRRGTLVRGGGRRPRRPRGGLPGGA